jgi:hypothetical protein
MPYGERGRAFYIGHDLLGESDLSAVISDFTVET